MATERVRVLGRQLALRRPYVGPRNTEPRLAKTWAEVLNPDCIGDADDFVDLGGDSYLAAAIFALIAELFGVRVPPATLIGSPTVAAMAREIERVLHSPGRTAAGRQ
jgi:acyl carrier protein